MNPDKFKKDLQFILRENLPDAWLDPDFARFYADELRPPNCAYWPGVLTDSALAQRLNEIPSETLPAERQFLYRFFKSVWSGENNVFEIGPFLGGTTRAIAMGMRDNPRRMAPHKLYTSDQFKEYYKPDDLRRLVMPLLQRGIISASDIEEIEKDASFLSVFRAVHRKQDYFPMIEVIDHGVPDMPEEVGEQTLLIPDGKNFDTFFVDGCKSWFGTKYFMLEACKNAKPGSYFIFQDYGHWTCFWISSFVGLMREHFDLISQVADTHAFQLVRPLTPDEIEKWFPDSATEVARADYEQVYARLSAEARDRGDRRSAVSHQIHLAAALGMLGLLDEAKQLLVSLYHDPSSVGFEKRIERAASWLTYYCVIENGFRVRKVIAIEKFKP